MQEPCRGHQIELIFRYLFLLISFCAVLNAVNYASFFRGQVLNVVLLSVNVV